ncbi:MULTISPECIES: N-acetyltransferase [Methylobacterium]|uniref:N-acetyltransferase Eis n=1 Tax=Methylobacterium jeotgali TaxID=381630 RepID=A0ABQ4SYI1_9HYPH|nr:MULTISPECIES: N-acetyltransferase [Methylobacterium]PIU08066.1 MAG: GNAT family N-acetyltransferase [Methylobacterium sp. CG09_land_8_20_14_0_10_71_15]PIU14655.1 MAG: GNAT family N-acetyltransferase [Methylobacterium sp. CG08_land_8_20_14_0_20_71_15]GBU18125.1 acetyltransferase [Methylobacterium sp.]GJE06978.1 N-acetyltransferase Eis [Methylobacterium jeotgali]
MIEIRDQHLGDVPARERLLDTCFGTSRFAKSSERLREGRRHADGLALSAIRNGRLVGTVRLWHVEAGPARPALLLGPLAVDPAIQRQGLGSVLMHAVLGRAEARGHGAVLLVGDAPYYARFGFEQGPAAELFMPGPFERARFLGLELRPGALAGASGVLRPTGVPLPVDVPAVATGARRQAA